MRASSRDRLGDLEKVRAMLIPWATDAPIYHRPWATIVLMVVSIVVFAMTSGLDDDVIEPYLLLHGEGLHPVQWITSNFLHENFMHLAGNLIFLWSFALVVEGKVGFFPFLAIFLGIGFAECALEQALTLGMDSGGSLGNSAIVYGIMAMALVWAPRNEVNCFWIFGFRGGLIDLSIFWFALLYIAWEIFQVVFWKGAFGMTASTAIFHLSGAAVGFVVAVALLKLDWVDCEGWDLFTVFGNGEGKSKSSRRKKARRTRDEDDSEPKVRRASSGGSSSVSAEDRAAAATRRLHGHLEAGSVAEAYASYDKSVRTVVGWMPVDADWLALIQALLAAQDWRAAVTVMEDYLRRSPKPTSRVRLRLAQVLVKELQRPAHALKILDEIPDGALPPNLETAANQLRRQAEQMREEGVLELDGDGW
jgi:membrane associated rhomboid family serine protease